MGDKNRRPHETCEQLVMDQRTMMDSCVMSLTEGNTNSENQLETDQILFLFSAPKMRILNSFGQFHFPTKMYFVVFGFLPFSAKNIYICVILSHKAVIRICDLRYTYFIRILYIGFIFVFGQKRHISFVFISVSD